MAKTNGYKFGNKNNWRRWQWNQISKRLTIPPKNAIVLYLAGKEDLDRRIAIEHGFMPCNLIAVDESADVINILRKDSKLCIHGNLSTVIEAFNDSGVKIDVLVADFCCGLTKNMQPFLELLASNFKNSFNKKAVISINTMRGRDGGDLLCFAKEITNNSIQRNHLIFNCFLSFSSQMVVDQMCLNNLSIDDFVNKIACYNFTKKYEEKSAIGKFRHYWCDITTRSSCPSFNSYKSKNIYMDSVVFTYPEHLIVGLLESIINNDTKKSIGAVLAIRTMRITGKLPMCKST